MRLGVGAVCLVLLGAVACTGPSEVVRVAAASDLQFALPDVAAQFTAETGDRIEIVFGSSGTLTRQILDGAPLSMFLSADASYVQHLAQAGRTSGASVTYAIGRLVLFAPDNSPLRPIEGLDGLAAAIATGAVRRFAIANPEYAPYGRAAAEVLRGRGVWDALQPSLVVGDNVAQAAQFALSGDATGGLIAYSLALAPHMRGRGTYQLIPADTHAPLRQTMVLLKGAGPIAHRFFAFMQTPAAHATLATHGFAVPR